MADQIVVISSSRVTRRQVSRALVAGGADVEFLERSPAPGARPDLCILDADSVGTELLDAVLGWAASGKVPVVLISLGADKSQLLDLLQSHEVGHLVAKHGAIRAVHPVIDERELLVTCQKVLRRDIFGIDKYVGGWGVKVHTFTVKRSSEKEAALEKFEEFLRNLDCPAAIIPEIVTVADELILNAVVHAPCTPDGKRKYEELGPRVDIELEPNEYVEVTYACDGQRLMLSVTDRFGRLEKSTLLNYLSKGLGSSRMEIEQKVSGAGLGLSMALLRIHQLVINVHERARTEVVAGWYLRVNTAAEFRQVSKSLNLFWLSAGEAAVKTASRSEPKPPARSSSHPPTQPNPVVAPPAAAPPPPSGAALALNGRIDERTSLAPLMRAKRLDLRRVTGFTSRGVVHWLRFVESLAGRKVEAVGCPPPLVQLATEVKGMLRNLAVKTVIAGYECAVCGKLHDEELPVGKAPAGTRPCQGCGGKMEFTGNAAAYEALPQALS